VTHEWSGTVRRDPVDKNLTLAAFTGNKADAFPNALIAKNVTSQNPDLLFFSGDQIYEDVGGFGIIRTGPDSIPNYLRKYYLFGWAFRDLMKNRPTIILPDDHDVYQGNVWGNGGNAISLEEHQRGGYVQSAAFVNAVHRTQVSHHPDAYDPTPIKQGITAYYGDMLYGRVSFAILADLDSNGWPQTGRNKALDTIRRGHALMIAGDQHLASVVHHGIDSQQDAGISFCVPSIVAGYPRSWRPDKEHRPVKNRVNGLANTGDYTEGFGNLVHVIAVANPEKKNRKTRLPPKSLPKEITRSK